MYEIKCENAEGQVIKLQLVNDGEDKISIANYGWEMKQESLQMLLSHFTNMKAFMEKTEIVDVKMKKTS